MEPSGLKSARVNKWLLANHSMSGIEELLFGRVDFATGENACPPEDVGGARGYAEFIAVIADNNHKEYDITLDGSAPPSILRGSTCSQPIGLWQRSRYEPQPLGLTICTYW